MYCGGKTFVTSNKNRSLGKLQLCTVQKHNFVLSSFKTKYFVKHTRRLKSIKWRKKKKMSNQFSIWLSLKQLEIFINQFYHRVLL